MLTSNILEKATLNIQAAICYGLFIFQLFQQTATTKTFISPQSLRLQFYGIKTKVLWSNIQHATCAIIEAN